MKSSRETPKGIVKSRTFVPICQFIPRRVKMRSPEFLRCLPTLIGRLEKLTNLGVGVGVGGKGEGEGGEGREGKGRSVR